MGKYQMAVIVGSLGRDSFDRRLATAMTKLAPSEFAFKQVEIGDLPLYSQDDDANQTESVKRLERHTSRCVGRFGTALARLGVPVLAQPEAFTQAKGGCLTQPEILARTAKSTCKAGRTSTLPA